MGIFDATSLRSFLSRHWAWFPSIFFCSVFFIEILCAFIPGNFVDRAFYIHHMTLEGIALVFVAFALILVFLLPVRTRVIGHIESLQEMGPVWRKLGPGLVFLGFAAIACYLKFLQYRGFQLPQDSANLANAAFNTLHGRWLQSPSGGHLNQLNEHFAFTVPLFSPVLLIWRSTLALLFIQAITIASMGLAVYILVDRLTRSSLAGLIGMLLVYSHPSYSEIMSASLENSVFVAPFFLWAMVAWQSKRWRWCFLFLALATTTREAFPFTVAGLGGFFIFEKGKPTRRRVLIGAGIVLGSALLWLTEMRIVAHFPGQGNESYWNSWFSHLGSSKEEVVAFVLNHPLKTVWKMIYPFSRLLPWANLFLHAAFLPFAAPTQLIVFLGAAFPQLLRSSTADFNLQSAPYMFGPLMFATAYGIAKVYDRWISDQRKGYFLGATLLICGLGFHSAARTLLPRWHTEWFDTAPDLIARIPPNASVWAQEFLSSWVACRSQLKILHTNDKSPRFNVLLFRPEYVLTTKSWFRFSDNTVEDRGTVFLSRHRYEKIAESGNLVLLKDPTAPHSGEMSPAIELPVPKPEEMSVLRNYVVSLMKGEDDDNWGRTGYPEDLRFAPDFAGEHLLMARELMRYKRMDLAVFHFERVLEERPRNIAAHASLGRIFLGKQNLDRALIHFMALLRLESDSAIAYSNICKILVLQKRFDEAIAYCEATVRVIPKKPWGHNNLGIAYYHLDRFEEARAQFEGNLQIAPENLIARGYLGDTLFHLGDLESAAQQFEYVVKKNPESVGARLKFGNLLMRAGRSKEAVAVFLEAARIAPDNPDVHRNLGNVYARMKRLKDAVSEIKTLIRIQPKDPESHNFLGLLHSESGNTPEAIRAFETALQLDPNHKTAKYNLRRMRGSAKPSR